MKNSENFYAKELLEVPYIINKLQVTIKFVVEPFQLTVSL
jgi:hypothetical protein